MLLLVIGLSLSSPIHAILEDHDVITSREDAPIELFVYDQKYVKEYSEVPEERISIADSPFTSSTPPTTQAPVVSVEYAPGGV